MLSSTIVTAENFDQLLDALLQTPDSGAECRIPGLKGNVIAGLCHIPAFGTDDTLRYSENGFADGNALIAHLLDNACGGGSWTDDYLLAIYYPEPTTGELSRHIRYFLRPFYLGLTDKGLQVLHADSANIADPVREMKALRPLAAFPETERPHKLEMLEAAMQALGRNFKLPFGGRPAKQASESSQLKDLVRLLLRPDGRSAKETETLVSRAAKAFKKALTDVGDRQEAGYALLADVSTAASDHRIAAEDMNDMLKTLTGIESGVAGDAQDVIGSAREAAEREGWALLHYDTGGDDFLFLAVYAADKPRVLHLAGELGLLIEAV